MIFAVGLDLMLKKVYAIARYLACDCARRHTFTVLERRSPMSRDHYDVAQICLNGHVVNDSAVGSPEHNKKFCDLCGKPTITSCQNCESPIQGYYYMESVTGYGYDRPAFCPQCGHAYPWTQAALDAAREFADELDELNGEEKELLKRSLDDIVGDTPRTPLAATKFKKYAAKAGKAAADSLKSILINVASETAKKLLWP